MLQSLLHSKAHENSMRPTAGERLCTSGHPSSQRVARVRRSWLSPHSVSSSRPKTQESIRFGMPRQPPRRFRPPGPEPRSGSASRCPQPLEALRVQLVDVLRARRPHREPAVRGHDLQPADRRAVAWRGVRTARIVSPASSLAPPRPARAAAGAASDRGRRRVDALVDRRAELAGELEVALAGIAAKRRRHLRGEQPRMIPSLSVVQRCRRAQERCARALLAAEAERAVEQAVDEPLEAHRHFDQSPSRSDRTRSIIPLLTTVLPTAPRAPRARCVTDMRWRPPDNDSDSAIRPSA